MSATPSTIEQEMAAVWVPLIQQNLINTYVCGQPSISTGFQRVDLSNPTSSVYDLLLVL